jgi:hypothetical protein
MTMGKMYLHGTIGDDSELAQALFIEAQLLHLVLLGSLLGPAPEFPHQSPLTRASALVPIVDAHLGRGHRRRLYRSFHICDL